MTGERKQQLYDLWSEETNDPESEDWREELTPEEAALVDKWDSQYETGTTSLATKILNADARLQIAQKSHGNMMPTHEKTRGSRS